MKAISWDTGRSWKAKPTAETAEALADTGLAIIPRPGFEELLDSHPAVMKKLIGIPARHIDAKGNFEEQLLQLYH